WMMGGAVRLFGAAADGVLHTDLKACDGWKTGPQAAANVSCPTLFLLGGRDRMTPARSARKLASLVTDARVQVIEKSGHMLMSEAPDETLDALVAFVTGD
ncbi:MAG: alpha/beta hydrolase, partial [Rhodospirillales bacterium]